MKKKSLFIIILIGVVIGLICLAIIIFSLNNNKQGKEQDSPTRDSQEESSEVKTDENETVVTPTVSATLDTDVGDIQKLNELTEDTKKEYYKDIDEKVLSGDHALEYIRKIIDKDEALAILVVTKMEQASTISLNEFDGNVSESTPTVGAKGFGGSSTPNEDDVTNKLTFVNYHALLAEDVMTYDTNHFVAEKGLKQATNGYVVNKEIENLGKAGSVEYLADYAQFVMIAVTDTEGDLIGIAFYELV